jgi:uncharacterized protein YjiS (DUF1127 family)
MSVSAAAAEPICREPPLDNFQRRLFSRFLAWYRCHTMLEELNAMSDRELADIGLLRCDIEGVAWNDVRNVRPRDDAARFERTRLTLAARLVIVTEVLSAIGEGLESAAHYDALILKTNTELKNIGLHRQDLPRIAMFGAA